MTDADFDALLGASLAPPERKADRRFVDATLLLVAEQQRYRAVRRRLWRDALGQAAGLGGLIAGLAVFSRLPLFAAFDAQNMTRIASPLVLVLVLWLVASGVLDAIRLPGPAGSAPRPAPEPAPR